MDSTELSRSDFCCGTFTTLRAVLLPILIFGVCSEVAALPSRVKADYSVKSWHRLIGYTDGERVAGQDHWLTFEQRFQITHAFSLKAQVYGYVGDSIVNMSGVRDRSFTEQDRTDLWPGEVYGQFVAGPMLLRLGYQRVYWQEGFGSSYTTFINARDNRISVFDDTELIFRSSPLANFVISGDNLSFQAIYIPIAQLDVPMPVSRWGDRARISAAPSFEIENSEWSERTWGFKKSGDYGARLTWAGEGFDLSIFHAKIIDRANIFSISPISNFTTVVLVPEFNTIDPVGVTSSFTVHDFVARIEYMRISDKRVNRIDGLNLTSSAAVEDALTVGLDSPAWPDFMFSLQHSISILDIEALGLVRNRVESVSFASINYNFPHDRVLRLAVVYLESDQSLLGKLSYRWPVSARSEIETSFEGSTGAGVSRGLAMSDLNRFFVQLNFTH